MSQRSKAPVIIATIAGLATLGAIAGVAIAATREPDNVSPMPPKPDDGDKGQASDKKSKGLPPPPKPDGDDKRTEPKPKDEDLYGDLPSPGGANRPRETRAAAAAIIKTAKGRAAVGADASDTLDAIADTAFFAVFATSIGKGKLTKDNATHEPYIKAWVRIRGDVGRMMAALPAIAGGNPFKGKKAASQAYVLWAMCVTATSPIPPSSAASAFYYARSYLAQNQQQLRPLLGKSSPSLGEAGLLAELAVRQYTKAALPPGAPWQNWSAASKAANGLWPNFPG